MSTEIENPKFEILYAYSIDFPQPALIINTVFDKFRDSIHLYGELFVVSPNKEISSLLYSFDARSHKNSENDMREILRSEARNKLMVYANSKDGYRHQELELKAVSDAFFAVLLLHHKESIGTFLEFVADKTNVYELKDYIENIRRIVSSIIILPIK